MINSVKAICVVCVLAMFSIGAYAQTNKVVIIPMSGDDLKPLKNIVTVAKENGDFSNPVTAIDAIGTTLPAATETNPYLVIIAPGIYTLTETLTMKEYVSITGSGQKTTKLIGSISTSGYNASSALVSGANNAAISSITLENLGGIGGNYSFALYNSGTSPDISNVSAIAMGGVTQNNGIFNYEGSSPNMTHVTASASGGASTHGVRNQNSSSPTITHSTFNASNGATNYGVRNITSSAPTMTLVTFTASGGTNSYGVGNANFGSATMSQVTATASAASGNNYGLFNHNSGSSEIHHSRMKGDDFGAFVDSSANIGQSTIIGGVGGGGTMNCVASDDGSGALLEPDCTVPSP
jgi:hypothetical protein